MKVVTVAEMRAAEQHAIAGGTTKETLMERAGSAVAEALAAWLPRTDGRRVLVLVGKGNNGGDALIAARHLQQRHGMRPRLYLIAARPGDPLLRFAAQTGGEVVTHDGDSHPKLREWLSEADVVLDGGLGIGQRLPLAGAVAEVMAICREVRAPSQRHVSVDVPTGVDADTGRVDECAFAAHLTLATGPAKPGLLLHPGARYAGRVKVLDIGLSDALADDGIARLAAAEVASSLPPRPDNSHKGTYGKLLVVAGSARYVGAASLTATAAVRSGVGLVTLAAPAHVRDATSGRGPEITFLPLPGDPASPGNLTPGHLGQRLDAISGTGYSAIAIGPGLGAALETRKLVRLLIERLAHSEDAPQLVIDADGLNALSAAGDWPHPRNARWVLTPHPGEMGRLSGLDAKSVQSDRLGLAGQKAREWGQIVVLKGAPAVIASPDGRIRLNAFANAALAIAGTGDVLTGVIAGFLAQGVAPFDAACAGSYIHALAGELWRTGHGAAGLPAFALAEQLPGAMDRIRTTHSGQ
ncbi:MAG TPA: NAD(P)H-hydrate dehydratase [Chloroflexota bacterium]|nr:NAD(P)H-hydrate dehydratase [Chloroflexota bacterium]